MQQRYPNPLWCGKGFTFGGAWLDYWNCVALVVRRWSCVALVAWLEFHSFGCVAGVAWLCMRGGMRGGVRTVSFSWKRTVLGSNARMIPEPHMIWDIETFNMRVTVANVS